MNFSIQYSDNGKTISELDKNAEIMVFDQLPNVETIGVRACLEGKVRHLDLKKTSITKISSNAFGDCKNLSEIILPDSLVTIEPNAFLRTSPTIINIPAKVKSMSGYAWNQINTVQCFVVDSSNPFFYTEEGFLFNREKTTLVRAPCFFNTSSQIPNIDSISEIGVYCFTDVQITSFECNSNIKVIGERAFHVLKCLKYVDLSHSSVTNLSSYVFNDCRELYAVKFPFTLETISQYAFSINEKLVSIFIYPYVTSISTELFFNCPSLTTIYYYGKNDFSSIQMCNGTTDANKVTVYTSFMYTPKTFGQMKVIRKHVDFIFTCNDRSKLPISFAFSYILVILS